MNVIIYLILQQLNHYHYKVGDIEELVSKSITFFSSALTLSFSILFYLVKINIVFC